MIAGWIAPWLVLLPGCPKPAPEAESTLQPVRWEDPDRTPPLPPPAPVDLGFHWPDGSACLMSTRRTETILGTGGTMVSTLNGVGSGVVVASRQADGTWEVALEDRSGTARHTPSDADLLVGLEEIELGLTPTLVVAADGRSVTEVRGLADTWDAQGTDLLPFAGVYGTEGRALWEAELPRRLAADALAGAWRAVWADGWGFAYGRVWEAGVRVPFTAADGTEFTATYRDVVPCKFNEGEPLCIRLELTWPERAADRPDARLRVLLPPGSEREATVSDRRVLRTAELVVEAGSGLPWRWTDTEVWTNTYAWGGETFPFTLRDKQDVSCDWRVAE